MKYINKKDSNSTAELQKDGTFKINPLGIFISHNEINDTQWELNIESLDAKKLLNKKIAIYCNSYSDFTFILDLYGREHHHRRDEYELLFTKGRFIKLFVERNYNVSASEQDWIEVSNVVKFNDFIFISSKDFVKANFDKNYYINSFRQKSNDDILKLSSNNTYRSIKYDNLHNYKALIKNTNYEILSVYFVGKYNFKLGNFMKLDENLVIIKRFFVNLENILMVELKNYSTFPAEFTTHNLRHIYKDLTKFNYEIHQ